MLHSAGYTDSACTAANIQHSGWHETDGCKDIDMNGTQMWYRLTCSGDDGKSQLFSDASCATKATYTGEGYTSGVMDPKQACIKHGNTSYAKYTCASQPSTFSYQEYSDSSCSTQTTRSGMGALSTCDWEMDDGAVKAKKYVVSGDVITATRHTTKDCSDTGTTGITGPLSCAGEAGDDDYYKITANSPAVVAGGSSSSSTNSTNGTKKAGSTSKSVLPQGLLPATIVMALSAVGMSI